MDAHLAMTETHRHLLQLLMAKRFIEEQELTDKLREYKSEHSYEDLKNFKRQNPQLGPIPKDDKLEEFIGTINSALSIVHMRITRAKHPKSKAILYTIVNELDDEISKLSTRFSADELGYFKIIVEALAESNELGRLEINNKRPKTMTLEASDFLIDALIEEGWLDTVEGGRLIFGIRSLTDLESTISELTD